MLHFLLIKGERSAAYILSGIFFLLIAMYGEEAGAFISYSALGVLCLVQYARPTLLGWGVVFSLACSGSLLWAYVLVSDIFMLIRDVPTRALRDLDDSMVFIAATLLTIALSVRLFFVRPKKNSGSDTL